MEDLLHLILITYNFIGNPLHDRNHAIGFDIEKVHSDWLVFPDFKPSLTVFKFSAQVVLGCYERSEAAQGRLTFYEILD